MSAGHCGLCQDEIRWDQPHHCRPKPAPKKYWTARVVAAFALAIAVPVGTACWSGGGWYWVPASINIAGVLLITAILWPRRP